MPADVHAPFSRYLFASFVEARKAQGGPLTEGAWLAVADKCHDAWHAAKRKKAGPVVSQDCHKLYHLYPRHVGKDAALRAIAKALAKPGVEAGALEVAVRRFKFCTDRWKREDREFIPHPATWFNEGRWQDDPREWEKGSGQAPLEKDQEPAAAPPKAYPEPAGWLAWLDRCGSRYVGQYATGQACNQDGKTQWADIPRGHQRILVQEMENNP